MRLVGARLRRAPGASCGRRARSCFSRPSEVRASSWGKARSRAPAVQRRARPLRRRRRRAPRDVDRSALAARPWPEDVGAPCSALRTPLRPAGRPYRAVRATRSSSEASLYNASTPHVAFTALAHGREASDSARSAPNSPASVQRRCPHIRREDHRDRGKCRAGRRQPTSSRSSRRARRRRAERASRLQRRARRGPDRTRCRVRPAPVPRGPSGSRPFGRAPSGQETVIGEETPADRFRDGGDVRDVGVGGALASTRRARRTGGRGRRHVRPASRDQANYRQIGSRVRRSRYCSEFGRSHPVPWRGDRRSALPASGRCLRQSERAIEPLPWRLRPRRAGRRLPSRLPRASRRGAGASPVVGHAVTS